MIRWLFLILLLIATPCYAQASRDRHDVRNADTDVVDKGHVEIEVDAINTHPETAALFDSTIHYGLGGNWEMQISLSPKGNQGTILGDTEVSIRKQYDVNRWHVGLQPFVVVPGKNSSIKLQGGLVTDLHYEIGRLDLYTSPQLTVNSKIFISQLYGASLQVNKVWLTRVEVFDIYPDEQTWYVSSVQEMTVSKQLKINYRINKSPSRLPFEQVITLVVDF